MFRLEGTHTVYTERHAATGVVFYEAWRKHGKRDRTDGPARIVRDPTTGTVIYEAWWKDDKLDRVTGPAVIEYNAATGTVIREEWWKDGARIDPPARPSSVNSAAMPPRDLAR